MVATNGLLGEKYLKVVPGGGVNYQNVVMLVSNTQGTMDLEDLIVNLLQVVLVKPHWLNNRNRGFNIAASRY